jgi:hypothetical protein
MKSPASARSAASHVGFSVRRLNRQSVVNESFIH